MTESVSSLVENCVELSYEFEFLADLYRDEEVKRGMTDGLPR